LARQRFDCESLLAACAWLAVWANPVRFVSWKADELAIASSGVEGTIGVALLTGPVIGA
jgi:hypothetical protein